MPRDPRALSAETWFYNCTFYRNVADDGNGGAVLLEGGCPAAFFMSTRFKVRARHPAPAGTGDCLSAHVALEVQGLGSSPTS